MHFNNFRGFDCCGETSQLIFQTKAAFITPRSAANAENTRQI
jgi:hypothetical protein